MWGTKRTGTRAGWPSAVALGAAGAGAAALVWLVMGALGLPRLLLAPQVVLWFILGVSRSTWLQRRIGGGRLDNQVVMRLVLGDVLATFAVLPTGMPFLVPICLALIAAAHLQWSGSAAWRLAAAFTVPCSAWVYVSVQLGPHAAPMTPEVDGAATVASLLLGIAMIATLGSLTAANEAGASALEDEQRRRVQELHHEATHDGLTGLLNRTGIAGRTPTARDGSVSERAVGVLFMDLDGFKAVNDTHGHAVGDQLLRAVSERLRTVFRAGDHLARMGGDEFVAVLGDLPDTAGLEAAARRVSVALRQPFDLDGITATIDVSVGMAWGDDDAVPLAELLEEADAAMYVVKHRHHADTGTRGAGEAPTPAAAAATARA